MKPTHTHRTTSQPPGLWVISLLGMLFCFGFCIINSSLVLYATSVFHIQRSEVFLLSASYNSLLFAVPLLGGFLSEQFGYRRSLILGPLLATLGLVLLATKKLSMLYLGLSLYVISVGYFVPSMYVMVGKLFSKDSTRRESAYTMQYIIMNLGFLSGAILGGYFQVWFNYETEYLIAAAVTFATFIAYLLTRHYITPAPGRITEAKLTWSKGNIWLTMLSVALAVTGLSYVVLRHPTQYDIALFILVILITLAIISFALKRNKKERTRLFAFIILSYFSVGFWTLYSLEPSLVTMFIQDTVNRHVFGTTVPVSSFYSLDAFFVISLGAILGYFWLYLQRINRNPSLPTKFSLSLITMAMGFFVLVLGTYFATTNNMVNPLYVVLSYFLLALAELLISPIGNSMVGRLSPEGLEGRLMGVWQLFTGVAGALSGILSQWAKMPKQVSAVGAHSIYLHAFTKIGSFTLVIAALSLIARGFLIRLIRD